MNELEAIQIQRRQIERQKEELEFTKRDLQRTEENYEEYFFKHRNLFNGLREELAHSQTAGVYEDMAHRIDWQRRRIHELLNEQQYELKKQEITLDDKENDLLWQERKIALEKGGGK